MAHECEAGARRSQSRPPYRFEMVSYFDESEDWFWTGDPTDACERFLRTARKTLQLDPRIVTPPEHEFSKLKPSPF